MRNAVIVLCAALCGVAPAQTSNVQTVRAWRRTHVMGIPGGKVLDPSGTIADGQRQAAVDAMVAESSNIVAGAGAGLTNALGRLYDAAGETNKFNARIYLAADMDDDPGCENLQAFVVAEKNDPTNVHYYTHYTRPLSVAPRTVWSFETAPGAAYWSTGSIDTNAAPTNILGYACYDICVRRPPEAGNMIMRSHKFLRWGAPNTPLDIPDEGLELVSGGVTNIPYTGSVTTTNAGIEKIRTFLSGFLYTVVTNEVPQ